MAENRKGVHVIANRSGMTYKEVKLLLFHIMTNTPNSEELAKRLCDRLREC